MEENPHRVSRRNQCGIHWRTEEYHRRNHRSNDGGGAIKCSGKKFRSAAAAAAIADCVALCCCPCAVLNLLTLALVKVPWMIGRRCLGRGGERLRFETEQCGGGGDDDDGDYRFVVGRDGSLTKEEGGTTSFGAEDGTTSFGVEDEARISARVEAERVWLDLYQIGHIGFGRVSFTGTQ